MYPLVLTNLDRLRIVVVGGGPVAERKVSELLAGGGRPEVISPQLTPQLQTWCALGQIKHTARVYHQSDLHDAGLVIAATDDPFINATIAHHAPSHCLVNVVDAPMLGNFHTVASVRRGDLLLTVSTGGSSPALAAQIRRELAERYGPEYVTIVGVFRRWRNHVNRRLSYEERTAFWAEVRAVLDRKEPIRNFDALVVDILARIAPQPAGIAVGK